jgi:hypothetical protein
MLELEDVGFCPYCGAKGYSCREDAMLESGVRIVRLSDGREPMYTLKERTHVNADSTKVVPEGSVEAAYFLGNAGDEISEKTAKRLGLLEEEKPAEGYEAKTVAELSELADAAGLDVGKKPKKADLVAALEAHDRELAAAGTGSSEPEKVEETGEPEKVEA